PRVQVGWNPYQTGSNVGACRHGHTIGSGLLSELALSDCRMANADFGWSAELVAGSPPGSLFRPYPELILSKRAASIFLPLNMRWIAIDLLLVMRQSRLPVNRRIRIFEGECGVE